MADILQPISKIRLPNGDIVPLSVNLKVVIPEDSEYNVTWDVNNFTGITELITGTDSDYLLTIPNTPNEFHNIIDELSKESQTLKGATLSWDSENLIYNVDKNPSSNSSFPIYLNTSGFPVGVSPGDMVIFGGRTGTSNVTLYVSYTEDGEDWTSLGNSYSNTTLARAVIPQSAIGLKVTIYAKSATAFTDATVNPIILFSN